MNRLAEEAAYFGAVEDGRASAQEEIDELKATLAAYIDRQCIQVGRFTIFRTRTPGKLHIRCGEGEGGEMPEEDFLKMVEQYYLAHF